MNCCRKNESKTLGAKSIKVSPLFPIDFLVVVKRFVSYAHLYFDITRGHLIGSEIYSEPGSTGFESALAAFLDLRCTTHTGEMQGIIITSFTLHET